MSSDRLAELKAKGWPNLNGSERKEMKALEGELGPVSENGSNETVTISKQELSSMVERLVQAQLGGGELDDPTLSFLSITKQAAKKPIIHTATLKRYRKDTDSPVGHIVDWKHLRYDYDEKSRREDRDIYKITVRYEGGKTEEVEVPLEAWATITDKIKVKILKQDKEPYERFHGFVDRKFLTKDGYVTDRATGTQVRAVEILDVYTATVELPDGDVFKMPSDRLNA